jgi:fibro-slime domain-containing protein
MQMFNKKRHRFIYPLALMLIIVGLGWNSKSFAQGTVFDSVIWVKVTYFDFHSDRSNPEFEQIHNNNGNKSRPNMVLNRLKNGLPVYNPSGPGALGLNRYIEKWFVPFKSGDKQVPNYSPQAALREPRAVDEGNAALIYLNGIQLKTVNHDTAFKNIVIEDSLPFKHIGGGVYEYVNDFFYPLDSLDYRTFGKEFNTYGPMRDHNYGFTMKIHRQFTKVAGTMRFDFTGDDDLWVFVDSTLALDIGGIHSRVSNGFDVNTIPGLQTGGVYDLHIFYAERHSDSSHIKITTNMIQPYVNTFKLKVVGDSTLTAGVPKIIIADATDQFENRKADWSDSVSWKISNPQAGDTILSPARNARNDSARISATMAHRWVTLHGTLTLGNVTKTDSVRLYVNPGTASQLVIEGNHSYSATSPYLNRSNPLQNITFLAKDLEKSAFAVVRDKFGNYISESKATVWTSLDSTTVSVRSGNQTIGEGVATRKVPLDTTQIVARNTTYNLRDSVYIYLSNFSFDSLRIVVRDSIPIDSLVMRTDQDTLLQAQGKRSFDGKWVNTKVDWLFKLRHSTDSSTQSGSDKWDFAPFDTGRGYIRITNGIIKDSIAVRINPGLPIKLRIYPKDDAPTDFTTKPSNVNVAYDNPSKEIEAVAGTSFPLFGKLFDHKDVWLPALQYTTSSRLTWSIQEINHQDSSGSLETDSGFRNSFMPKKAYRNVYIIAQYRQTNGNILVDTVQLKILPGPVTNLFIEGSSAWTSSPNRENPIDSIKIPVTSTQEPVYALLRDRYGNFVRYANVIQWGVAFNDTNVSPVDGNRSIGEGIIRSKLAGIDTVFAVDSLGFRDSVIANVLGFYYTELRIVCHGDTAIRNLVMSTNFDTLLTVQGKRSDNRKWENTSSNWGISSSLNVALNNANPGMSSKFLVSPVDTGTGWIRVYLENSVETNPDSIFVKFTPGEPIKAEISILTPENQRFAGKPIDCKVTIYNADNKPVRGTYCFNADIGESVKYTDILKARNGYTPFIMVDGKKLLLSENGSQCFESGVDTVKVTLYYAPIGSDTLHQITANLDNLIAKTEKFKLLPGPLDSMILENSNGKVIDTLKLEYPQGSRIFAVGFDEFGNRIGPELSNWSTDSTLHKVDGGISVSNLYYDAASVSQNEGGRLTAVSTAFPDIKASIPVVIIGPGIKMIAITRDDDGNGYLDHIEIHFSHKVTIPKNSLFPNNFSVKHGYSFVIDSIENNTGRTDSVWRLALREYKTDEPQTNWKPVVTIEEMQELGIAANIVTAIDGAGPVIWRVEKKVFDHNNRRQDVITVVLSEPIVRMSDLVRLSSTDKPASIFNVYESQSDGTFKPANEVLNGIGGINENRKDSVLTFMSSGDYEITNRHFFNLKWDESSRYVADKANPPNIPQIENQKVRCIVRGDNGDPVAVPNPSVPTARRESPGFFSAGHNPNALDWLKADRAGFGFLFPMTLSDSLIENVRIRYTIKIYDFVGNIVEQNIIADLIQSIRDSGEEIHGGQTIDVVSYWNGFTKDGMKAAPGLYKAVIMQKSTWRGSGKPPKDFVPESTKSIIIGVNSGNANTKKQ